MDLMEIDDSKHMRMNLTMQGIVTKVDLQGRKPPFRRASVCLGLMCTLLFVANVGQFLYYYKFINPTSENLNQTAYISGEQLKVALSNVTRDKEQLQKSYNTVKQERDQLQTNYSRLETVEDQLEKDFKKVRGDLTREKDQLQQSYNTVKQEKDQLQTNYNNAQRNLNNLQREKSDLQTQFNTLRTNRDELQRSNAALKSEKDQLQRSKNSLQSQFNSLQREKDQLRTDYNSVTQVRDQLQQQVTALDRPCPASWTKFGTCTCIYVSSLSRSWSSSRDFCTTRGGHLAILNNNDKMTFVNGLLKPGAEAWIGLTDGVKEGTWKWVDGSTATTTFWGSGQPNSYGGNQDCVEFTQSLSGGHWNDEGCSNEQICICEKSL